jgi:hypothetical protein
MLPIYSVAEKLMVLLLAALIFDARLTVTGFCYLAMSESKNF